MAADTTVTTNAAQVAPELQPYVSANLQNLSNLTNPNITPYHGLGSYYQDTGQSPFAGFNPMDTKAMQGAMNLGPSMQTSQASDMAAGVGNAAMNAGSNYMNMATNPYATGAFMSPYMQNVVDQQKNAAVSDYARSIPGMGSNAAHVGGLGGTRSALVQAEGQRNLGNQLGNIQATGLQNAYQNAQQNMQFGANQNMQGLGLANTAAGNLGNLGYSDFTQKLQSNQNLGTYGSNARNYQNQIGGANFNDYLQQQNYPLTSAQTMNAAIRNVPTTGYTSSTSNPSSSTSNLLGNLTGIVGLYNSLYGG